jgi:hypothetical protein
MLIRAEGENLEVSDGYHTFEELYDHRITLYIALCAAQRLFTEKEIWRSKYHSDGELCFGTGTQFVLGIGSMVGKQITYHVPIERWDETNFAVTLEKAPEWDGHTSADVLARLKSYDPTLLDVPRLPRPDA